MVYERNNPYLPSVPGLGFEPKLADSESAVLPLDDPGVMPLWALV